MQWTKKLETDSPFSACSIYWPTRVFQSLIVTTFWLLSLIWPLKVTIENRLFDFMSDLSKPKSYILGLPSFDQLLSLTFSLKQQNVEEDEMISLPMQCWVTCVWSVIHDHCHYNPLTNCHHVMSSYSSDSLNELPTFL